MMRTSIEENMWLHVYLGLDLTSIEYTTVSTNSYVRHINAYSLVITSGTAENEAIRRRKKHKEAQIFFRKTVNIEESLTKNIHQKMQNIYLTAFRNQHNNSISAFISLLLLKLLSTIGMVPEEILQLEEENLQVRVFNTIKPSIKISNELVTSQELATTAGIPYTNPHIIISGIRLMKKFNYIEKTWTKWYNLPTINWT